MPRTDPSARSPAGAESPRSVLTGASAELLKQDLARLAPGLRLDAASVLPDHAEVRLCSDLKRCIDLRLDAPDGCADDPVGAWCVTFPRGEPDRATRSALTAALGQRSRAELWLEPAWTPEPRSTSLPPPPPPAPPPPPPSTSQLWLGPALVLLVPVLAGLLLGAGFGRRSRRALRSGWLYVPCALAVAVGVAAVAPLLRVGLWDGLCAAGLLLLGVNAGWPCAPREIARALSLQLVALGLALCVAEVVSRRATSPTPDLPPPAAARLRIAAADPTLSQRDPYVAHRCSMLFPGQFPAELSSRLAEAPAQRPRVLYLGDSMVFGAGVARQQAFPAVLARLRPEASHVNAAVTGSSLDFELVVARHWLRRVPSDLVVLGLYPGNDVAEIGQPEACCADGPLLDFSGPEPSERCPEPRWSSPSDRGWAWVAARSPPPYLVHRATGFSALARRLDVAFLGLSLRLRDGDAAAAYERNVTRVPLLLRALRDQLAEQRVALVVLVLPQRVLLEGADPASEARRSFDFEAGRARHASFVSTAQGLGIVTLDAWELFAPLVARDGSTPWFSDASPHDIHFSVAGHEQLASWLASRIGHPAAADAAGAGWVLPGDSRRSGAAVPTSVGDAGQPPPPPPSSQR